MWTFNNFFDPSTNDLTNSIDNWPSQTATNGGVHLADARKHQINFHRLFVKGILIQN